MHFFGDEVSLVKNFKASFEMLVCGRDYTKHAYSAECPIFKIWGLLFGWYSRHLDDIRSCWLLISCNKESAVLSEKILSSIDGSAGG